MTGREAHARKLASLGISASDRDSARASGQTEPGGVGTLQFLDREGYFGQRLLQPGDPPVLDRPQPVPGGPDFVVNHAHRAVAAACWAAAASAALWACRTHARTGRSQVRVGAMVQVAVCG
jgi:hypothetical protein